MMAKLVINFAVNRNTDGLRSHQINRINISINVSELRFQVADICGLRPENIDLIYGGRCLQDDKPLEAYGVSNGANILVMKKSAPAVSEHTVFVDETKIKGALKIARSRHFERALEQVLGNPSTFASLIANSSSLANDPIARALVNDPNLLRLCTQDDASWKRAVEAHPGLDDIVVQLTNLVSAELRQPKKTATRQQYNLDRMYDEEEDEEGDDDVDSVQADPNFDLPVLPRGSAITADFLRQAMQAVATVYGGSSGQSSNVAQAPTAPAVTYEHQLRQLRDMGIMDEVLALRALQMTGGDVQSALAFIFADP